MVLMTRQSRLLPRIWSAGRCRRSRQVSTASATSASTRATSAVRVGLLFMLPIVVLPDAARRTRLPGGPAAGTPPGAAGDLGQPRRLGPDAGAGQRRDFDRGPERLAHQIRPAQVGPGQAVA